MLDTLLLRPSLHFTTLVDTSLLPIQTSLNFTSQHLSTLSFSLTHLNFLLLHFTSREM
jgi:hypothetical protein